MQSAPNPIAWMSLLITACLMAPLAAVADDCNSNGIQDEIEIAGGTGLDCNTNGIPDDCELQTVFSGEQIFTNATRGVWSLFAADLDGDGDTDVLSASLWDEKVAWYENTDGIGGFGPQRVITNDAENATCVFAKDLDSDGDVDVLSASNLDGKIAWYENIGGQGDFGPEQIITTDAGGTYSAIAADLDGDGDSDVLFAAGEIAWYENIDGMGKFGTQMRIVPDALWATSVFAADLDGDGDLDVLSASRQIDKIAWYENIDGLGGFGPQQVISTDADDARSVFAADLDGDGDLDVLSASLADDKIAWYENIDGPGGFGPQQVISADAVDAQSVFAADLDGDGDLDILAASSVDYKIAWYENTDGLGGFGSQQIITTAYSASLVYADDLDGDGRTDVLSAAHNGHRIAWQKNTTLNDCNNNDTPDDCDIAVATSMDCNNSGLPDECELAYNDCNSNRVPDDCDLTGNTSNDCNLGGVPDECEIMSGTSFDCNGNAIPDLCDVQPFTTGEEIITTSAFRTYSVFAADLDGDEHVDVLAAMGGVDRIAWYANTNGLGDLGPERVVTNEADFAISVFAADFDGDGDQDVLSASYVGDSIAWHENTDGQGNFGPQLTISTATDGAWCVFAADLDGDGDNDVLSSSIWDEKIAWYENMDGQGGFGPQRIITNVAERAFSVLAADLDGDGDMDVLAAQMFDSMIVWYENIDGKGNFSTQHVVAADVDGAASVFAADVDGDGAVDVVSALNYDDKIVWYANTNGLGGFGPQQTISILAEDAWNVFAADIDADGDVDVLSASVEDDKIAWYRNVDGRGRFGRQQIISNNADDAVSVFAADLDGDGDCDVLSASPEDNKLAWYRNTRRECNGNGIPDDCEADWDADGLIDDCDPCADGPASGDSDASGIVDKDDFIDFGSCLSGPGGGLGIGCECFDLDGDNDTDLQDFQRLATIQYLAIPGDIDGDNDLDLNDYLYLADCLAGPAEPPAPSFPGMATQDCVRTFDFDGSGHVDLRDFAAFERRFSR
jgi:hypothetical protein